MRKLLFASLFLLLAAAASAAIDLQNSVAANSVWSFSVSLPEPSAFSSAKILLDDSQLIKIISDGSNTVPWPNSMDAARVSSNAVVGNSVYLSVVGLPKGAHTIKVQVDDWSPESREVYFFEAMDAAEQSNLQSQLNSLKASVDTLTEEVNSFPADYLRKEDKDQLLAEISALKGKIDSMQSSLDSVAADESQNKQGIQGLITETQQLRQQTTKLDESMQSGFFGWGKLTQGTGLIAALLIVAIIVIIIAYSKRHLFHFKKSLYGKRMNSEDLGATLGEEDGVIDAKGLAAEAKPGKWALEKPVEEKRRRFHFGDLIKKG